jgi:hypothetical protein
MKEKWKFQSQNEFVYTVRKHWNVLFVLALMEQCIYFGSAGHSTSDRFPEAWSGGVVPCSESTLFRNTKSAALANITSSYSNAGGGSLGSVQSSIDTLSRLEAYEQAGFVCGSTDGLPRLLPGTTGLTLSSWLFILIAGAIARASRTYQRYVAALPDPTAQSGAEIKLDLLAVGLAFSTSLLWPVLLPAALNDSQFVRDDDQISVSPR